MTMYLEHFGLREAPFRITPHTEFFFAGANRGATLEGLLYAITAGEGLVKVTGEVGSGKTMLCRVLIERLPQTVETIYLAVPSLTRDEMLASIASDLGLETAGATTHKLMRSLQEKLIELHTAGRQVVALIDEAHAMPLGTLEEIRLLSNLETGTQKLLQIVLFGQPELEEHLALPNMRQLKERITHSFGLAPLPPRDIKDYIDFRLRAAGYRGPDLFGPEALRIIAEASEGLTRRINIYADKTLLAAFAGGTHTITADHARAAVSDTQIVMARRESPRRMAMVGAAAAVAGLAIGFAAGRLSVNTPSVSVAASTPMPAAVASMPAALAPAPVEPLPARPAAPIPVAATTSLDPIATRLAAGRDILASTGSQFAVQLMVTDARERAYLAAYLADAGQAVGATKLFLAEAGAPESLRYGVLYGPFRAKAEAVDALNALPAELRQFSPYVRTLDAVRDDVRRATRH
jgi:type II secretory pathway predicted ATPase ExeA/septal ring-binding cell division protein DamX